MNTYARHIMPYSLMIIAMLVASCSGSDATSNDDAIAVQEDDNLAGYDACGPDGLCPLDGFNDSAGPGANETADGQTDQGADVVTGQDIKVVGVFEDRCAIPDCDAIAATNPDFVPQPGVNCWDGHLKYWLADAKSMFVAAAIIDVGTVFETREVRFTTTDNGQYEPYKFSVFSDTSVKSVIFGEGIQPGLIVGMNYGTSQRFDYPSLDNYHAEDWFVYPGEALAFFGFDCVIDAAYPGAMSIYRLFPIRDGQVLDYDARPMPLQDVVTAINSGIVKRPDGYPTFGYSICPDVLVILP